MDSFNTELKQSYSPETGLYDTSKENPGLGSNCYLPNNPIYYVEHSHGGLINNSEFFSTENYTDPNTFIKEEQKSNYYYHDGLYYQVNQNIVNSDLGSEKHPNYVPSNFVNYNSTNLDIECLDSNPGEQPIFYDEKPKTYDGSNSSSGSFVENLKDTYYPKINNQSPDLSYDSFRNTERVNEDLANHYTTYNINSHEAYNNMSNNLCPNLDPESGYQSTQNTQPKFIPAQNPNLTPYPGDNYETTSMNTVNSLEPPQSVFGTSNFENNQFFDSNPSHPLAPSTTSVSQKKFDINRKNKSSFYLKSQREVPSQVKTKCEICGYEDEATPVINNRKTCSICINNLFEQFLQESSKGQFKLFEKEVLAKDIKDHVLEESYILYLERGRLLNPQGSYFNKPLKCNFCGLLHVGKHCKDFFFEKASKICSICDKKYLNFENDCSDNHCEICVKNSLMKQIKENPFETPICIDCKKSYSDLFLFKLFGSSENYYKAKDFAVEEAILCPSIDCSICYLQFKVSEMVTLYCDHRFCKSCIKGYFSNCINTKDLESLRKCPQCKSRNKVMTKECYQCKFSENKNPQNCPQCKSLKETKTENYIESEIEIYTVLEYLDEREKGIFNTLSLKSIKSDEKDKSLFMKWCKDCDFGMFIKIGINQEFKCPNCKSSFCVKCNTKHLRGPCPDFRKLIKSDTFNKIMDDKHLRNLMKEIILCPNCGEGLSKISGCNFMTCEWPKCNGVNFCSICSKILDVSQYFSHYKKSGPFGMSCNTTDKIKED